MKTNTEYLLNAFGYQGGTIHQLAEETGLTTSEILELDKHTPETARGYLAIQTKDIKDRRTNIFPKEKGNIDFWYGVLRAMISFDY